MLNFLVKKTILSNFKKLFHHGSLIEMPFTPKNNKIESAKIRGNAVISEGKIIFQI
jgi:hypothetical protein